MDQSTNMALKYNQESFNEIASPKNFNSVFNPKDFTRQHAQENSSINTEFNLIEKSNNFYFTDSKIEEQFNYDYHHWAANNKVMEIINKRDKSPEALRLIEGRKKVTKTGNLRFKIFDSLNRNVWIIRRQKTRETHGDLFVN